MEDSKLIIKCKNGEKQAFQELISKYHPFVYKFLYKISGSKYVAEDLTQETFIKIIRSIDKFDLYGTASFATYLISISKNCYIDYFRKEKRKINALPIDKFNNIECSTTSIENIVVEKIQSQNILEKLTELTEDQQIIIKMKYIEDMTLKEIGEILNIEPKTVKSRIHNGITKLRAMLKGGG